MEAFDLTDWGRALKPGTDKKFKAIFKEKYWKSTNVSQNVAPDKPKAKHGLNLNALYLKKPQAADWETEIAQYLATPRVSEEVSILDWWRANELTFPNLARMARDILCIMPSSVPVERLFSDAGKILRPERCCLKDNTLKMLLSIKSWMRDPYMRQKLSGINF